jgi:hypothetical protein
MIVYKGVVPGDAGEGGICSFELDIFQTGSRTGVRRHHDLG